MAWVAGLESWVAGGGATFARGFQPTSEAPGPDSAGDDAENASCVWAMCRALLVSSGLREGVPLRTDVGEPFGGNLQHEEARWRHRCTEAIAIAIQGELPISSSFKNN